MSRLTIAIPTFRRPEDLKRAVGGVLEQASELAAGPTTEASGPRTDAEAGTEDDAAGATDAKGGAGEDVSETATWSFEDIDSPVLPRPFVDVLEQVPVNRSHVVAVVGPGNSYGAVVDLLCPS